MGLMKYFTSNGLTVKRGRWFESLPWLDGGVSRKHQNPVCRVSSTDSVSQRERTYDVVCLGLMPNKTGSRKFSTQ